MGFGILLIGYALAFAFALSPYYFFADIFGGLVMAYAFFKLSAFQRKFRYAGITSIIYAVFSCINMLERLSIVNFPPIIGKLTEALVAGCVITVHIFMFISISALAEEVGLPKLNMKARRNLIVLILYYLFYSLALLSFDRLYDFYPNIAVYTAQFFSLFQIFWLLLNIILIGSCCKWIGVEGEELPKSNPSKYDRIKEKWSEAEDRIFTPKGKRNTELKPDTLKNRNSKKSKKK